MECPDLLKLAPLKTIKQWFTKFLMTFRPKEKIDECFKETLTDEQVAKLRKVIELKEFSFKHIQTESDRQKEFLESEKKKNMALQKEICELHDTLGKSFTMTESLFNRLDGALEELIGHYVFKMRHILFNELLLRQLINGDTISGQVYYASRVILFEILSADEVKEMFSHVMAAHDNGERCRRFLEKTLNSKSFNALSQKAKIVAKSK